MGVFEGFDADLPTQLWISARYLESISFLIAPVLLRRKINYYLLLAIYALATFAIVVAIFWLRIFPHCFIEGQGLTPFKKVSEYIICMILSVALLYFYRMRSSFNSDVFSFIALSIITTIFAELAFTFYISVYGLSNLIGHIFKIISFYLLYKAIVETGIRKPFDLLWRELRLSEEQLRIQRNMVRAYLDMAGAIILEVDAGERVTMINRRGCEIIGAKEDEIVGKNLFLDFIPEDRRAFAREMFTKLFTSHDGSHIYFELPLLDIKGNARIIAWNATVIKDKEGGAPSILNLTLQDSFSEIAF
jgi:PAS domain S-box-containing protein